MSRMVFQEGADEGVCQVASVVEVAVSTCPLEGAVAVDTETTVVAVLSPEAVRSSDSLVSSV
jgi:hypothetical protein